MCALSHALVPTKGICFVTSSSLISRRMSFRLGDSRPQGRAGYTSVKSLLIDVGLHDSYFSIFVDNVVDDQALSLLDESHLKEMSMSLFFLSSFSFFPFSFCPSTLASVPPI